MAAWWLISGSTGVSHATGNMDKWGNAQRLLENVYIHTRCGKMFVKPEAFLRNPPKRKVCKRCRLLVGTDIMRS